MKKIILLTISVLSLSSCEFFRLFDDDTTTRKNSSQVSGINNPTTSENKPKYDETFSYREHYCEFDSSSEVGTKYWIRNGYKNDKDIFLSTWNKNNYALGDDNGKSVMQLSLTDEEKKGKIVPYGAEVVSYSGYLYGYFGIRAKTFKREGTVQSFFTYNGPTSSHPEYEWDEIDIEFLGKDTTKVQFNYFDNGVGNHEYMYDLGFDSSLDYHDYGFVWRENQVTWFVDFEPVYQIKASLNQWGFFMMNVWGGNPESETAVNWLGSYQESTEKFTTNYDYVIASEFKN